MKVSITITEIIDMDINTDHPLFKKMNGDIKSIAKSFAEDKEAVMGSGMITIDSILQYEPKIYIDPYEAYYQSKIYPYPRLS